MDRALTIKAWFGKHQGGVNYTSLMSYCDSSIKHLLGIVCDCMGLTVNDLFMSSDTVALRSIFVHA